MSRRLAWLMAAVLLSGPVSNVAAAAGPAGHPKAEVVAGQRDPNAGECFVFHVTDNEMVAAHRKSNGWGVTLRKPIATAREQSATP